MRMKAGMALGLAALSFLTGCVAWTGPVSGPAPRTPPAAAGYFDFSWELSGERQAAPLQVFDDGHRMWLQFSPSQGEPALWRPAPEGDLRAVDYSRQGPYLVLEQIWPELIVQTLGRQASVRRQAPPALPSEPVLAAARQVAPGDAPPVSPASSRDATRAYEPLASKHASAPEAAAVSVPVPGAGVAASVAETAGSPPSASFSVERADGHMRRTLARWADQAGWIFQAEHWNVDVDIPIVGDAVFDPPFEQAVQSLLAATELSDRPLQPCFYSNKVVRVVAYAQACDRSAPPGERA